jgi:hypothetical protein
MDREVELLTAAGKGGKLSLAHAGRVQELLQHAAGANVSTGREGPVPEAGEHRRDREREEAEEPQGDAAPLPRVRALLAASSSTSSARAASSPTTWVSARRCRPSPSCSRSSRRRRTRLRALIVAPTSVVTNWERELERFAPTLKRRPVARRGSKGPADEVASRGDHHQLRAAAPRRGVPHGRSTSRTPSSTRPSTSRTRCRRPRPRRSGSRPGVASP